MFHFLKAGLHRVQGKLQLLQFKSLNISELADIVKITQ